MVGEASGSVEGFGEAAITKAARSEGSGRNCYLSTTFGSVQKRAAGWHKKNGQPIVPALDEEQGYLDVGTICFCAIGPRMLSTRATTSSKYFSSS